MAKIIKGQLNCGFNYEVDLAVAEDMRFLDALAEMQEDALQFSKAVKMLLGVEQRNALYAYLDEKGIRPDATVIGDILIEIMTSQTELKNS